MSIDSAQKRMSVFELPGLMTNPFPSGSTNTQANRQQMSDIYSGILVSAPLSTNETCWIPSLKNTSAWKSQRSNTNVWRSEKTSSKVWVNEKEVVPCQD